MAELVVVGFKGKHRAADKRERKARELGRL